MFVQYIPPPQQKFLLNFLSNYVTTNNAEFFTETADKRQEETWQQKERVASGNTAKIIIIAWVIHLTNRLMFEL
jgi:hypothetical protein